MIAGRLAFVLTCAVIVFPAFANLDEEAPPFDYTRLTKGGKYVFVMLRPKEWRKYAYNYRVYSDSSTQKYLNRDGDLQERYPISGLYRNDGSKTPLWTVDWYSFDVWPCSDGLNIVRWGPWARSGDKGQTLALAFYKNGTKIRDYRVADLVTDYEDFPHSISHYQWAKQKNFDDAGKRIKIQLFKGHDYRTAGQTLLFDIPNATFKVTGGN